MNNYEEKQNRKLLFAMYIIVSVSLIFYLITLWVTVFFVPEGIIQTIIILVSTIILLISCLIALKFEVDAGYYKCKNCNNKFVTTYKEALFAMHIGTTRRLKCPKCNQKNWSKKVMRKEEN